jgi:glycosyltransferase involved in cell wall biosynthesis
MNQLCVALLGQRDQPTDAVEEYCNYLAGSLRRHGISLELKRVGWAETGWRDALSQLKRFAGERQAAWFLLQYTALAWSRRGFSWRVLSVIRILKKAGVRCAVVFHDAEPYFGNRWIDRFRRALQLYIMRNAMRLADLAIFTIPPEKIPWARNPAPNAVFIPVGANLPSPERAWTKTTESPPSRVPTVAVFSLSEGQVGAGEAHLIGEASCHAADQLGALRILLLGRNAASVQPLLQERLRGKPVELVVHGILAGDEVVRLLGTCDVMLFVRGPLSTRRGSALAGIACGLPLIAREGWETAPPITEAGVVLLPPHAMQEFGPALVRVLTEHPYRAQLAERSRHAQTKYFSWEAIAAAYARALANSNSQNPL